MYAQFFGLTETPFSITPDPRFLYMSQLHQEALAHLLYGTGEDGGFVQLTGEVGTGKTTLLRALLEQNLEQVDLALILNPRVTTVEFVATICDELGVDYRKPAYTLKPVVDALNAHLLETHRQGRQTVLVVDEAQNLSRDVLEQVRLLTNLETSRHKLLRIILVGQPELQRVLGQHDMRQLAQRITGRYHLGPLSEAETAEYIAHRLAVVGSTEELLVPAAVKRVYRLSGGVPRLINIICDRALLGAYSQNLRQVSPGVVNQAAREALDVSQRKQNQPAWTVALGGAAAVLALTAVGYGLYRYAPGLGADRDAAERAESTGVPVAEVAMVAVPEDAPDRTESGDANPDTPLPPAPDGKPKQPEATAGNEPSTTPKTKPMALATATPGTGAPVEETGTPPPKTSEPTPPPTTPATLAATDGAPPAKAVAPMPPETTASVAGVSTNLASSTPAPPPRPSQAANTAAPAGPPVGPGTGTELAAELVKEPRDTFAAYRGLFGLWNESLNKREESNPCIAAYSRAMRCIQGKATLEDLRAWNRPALLRLADTDDKPHEVLLQSLDAETATLKLSDGPVRVPVTTLAPVWSGHVVVLWRLQTSLALIGRRSRGEPVLWLRSRLDMFDGEQTDEAPGATVFDEVLEARVKRFQSDQGLDVDGIVGARTMLLLNNLKPRPGTPTLSPGQGAG